MKAKFYHLIFFLVLFNCKSIFATDVSGGNVSGHWILTNSPYRILGNITIPVDSLLEIDSGVTVEFQGHYQFKINGKIHANGTELDPIMFDAVIEWWGFRFDGISASQDSSLFTYCTVQNSNANGSGNYTFGGGFFISAFSKIRIEGCIIRNNTATYGGAIYCINASPNIYGNEIYSNHATSYYGGAIYGENSSPSIVNNIITNNGGQIDFLGTSSPEIIGNIISNSGGHGIGLQYTGNANIINNIITHNSLAIVSVGVSPNIIGNLIAYNSGNDYGPGIFCYHASTPQIVNNTIAYNHSNMYGGGICIGDNCTPVIMNTILWGNTAFNHQGDQIALLQSSQPVFYNCDIQSGSGAFYYWDAPGNFTGTYIDCIDADPLFVLTTTDDLSIQPGSPCVNAGGITSVNLPPVDLAGNPRLCNNVLEIGAYEICNVGIQNFEVGIIPLKIFPVPAHDRLFFEIEPKDISKNMSLQLYTAFGVMVRSISFYSSIVTIPVDQLSPGIYFYQINNLNCTLNKGKVIIE
jgi:parallel beta-helix repeat protein